VWRKCYGLPVRFLYIVITCARTGSIKTCLYWTAMLSGCVLRSLVSTWQTRPCTTLHFNLRNVSLLFFRNCLFLYCPSVKKQFSKAFHWSTWLILTCVSRMKSGSESVKQKDTKRQWWNLSVRLRLRKPKYKSFIRWLHKKRAFHQAPLKYKMSLVICVTRNKKIHDLLMTAR